MTSVNSSSQISPYASKGLSGLVSGMDTEKMVSDMLSGTQIKIDKANQDKQQLVWKQELYRDVISSLSAFQSKFFSFSSEETNLLSRSFYNSMNADVSGSSITAVASATAYAVPMTVDNVSQLATQTKVTSLENTMGSLEGVFNKENLDNIKQSKYLGISVDGIDAWILIRGSSEPAIISNLNADFEEIFGQDMINASVVEGKLTIESMAPDKIIKIREDSGDAALDILGLIAGEEQIGKISGQFDASQVTDYLTITLDGISKRIEIDLEAADIDEFASSLQQEINKLFGNSIQITVREDILEFAPTKTSYDEYGNPVVTDDNTRQIIFTGSTHVMDVFSMSNGQSNKVAAGMELRDISFKRELIGIDNIESGESEYRFSINATEFVFSSSDSLSSMISGINASDAGVTITYSSLEDRFSLISKEYGAGFSIEMDDLEGSNLMYVLFGDNYVTESGRNAELSINGQETQRSGNTFNVDGVMITLKETTDVPAVINVTRNSEQIANGIIEFVNEYNKLIDELNDLIHSKPTYRDYPPLTTAQKNEMSDREIELWEEKAKEGLLYNDSGVYRLLDEMRRALYSRVPGSSYALYDLGIDTSNAFKDYGKLVVTDKSKLINAIEADTESIGLLFADEQNGIASKINSVTNRATKVSYAGSGSLVQLAGTAAHTGRSSIDRQIGQIETRLEELKKRYETEKSRYWAQFSKMEELINTMNQQSNWLYNMFNSGT